MSLERINIPFFPNRIFVPFWLLAFPEKFGSCRKNNRFARLSGACSLNPNPLSGSYAHEIIFSSDAVIVSLQRSFALFHVRTEQRQVICYTKPTNRLWPEVRLSAVTELLSFYMPRCHLSLLSRNTYFFFFQQRVGIASTF